MKRIGKLVLMTERELNSFAWLNEDIQNEVKFWHDASATWDAERANRRAERKKAFQAGVFHASGGYAKAMKDLRAKLAGTTATMCRAFDLLAKWRPLVESLETYPNQFVEIGFDGAMMHFPVKRWNKDGTAYLATVQYQDKQYPDHQVTAMLRELAHGDDVSDADAGADFDVVGVAVAQERRRT
jgi:hypothetical protein